MPTPATAPHRAPARRLLARTVGYAAAYLGMVWLGRASRLDGSQVALVWPAAGIAVLWIIGSWRRPAWLALDTTLLAALTFAGTSLTGAPIALAAGLMGANVAQALATSAVLAQLPGSLTGERAHRGLARLTVAAVVGACVGGIIGPALLSLIGGPAWPVEGAIWVFRNAVGSFLVVSAGVLLLGSSTARRGRSAASAAETAAYLLGGAGITTVVFGATVGVPVSFAIVPAAVLVGLRCSVRAATVHALLTWAVVAVSTFHARGPFVGYTPDERVLLVQALMAVIAFLTLALALTRHEERTLHLRLGEERAFVDALVGQLSTDLFICDQSGAMHVFDPARQTLVPAAEGLSPAQWPEAFGVYTADGSRLIDHHELPLFRALQGERIDEPRAMVMRGDDGIARDLMVTAAPILDSRGRQRGALARAVDVTEQRRAEAEARQRADDLATVVSVARRLASETDLASARETICAAVRQTADAPVALLFEPNAECTHLTLTAADGYDAPRELSLPLGGARSGVSIAFASGAPFFVARAERHAAVHQPLVEATGVRSAVMYPVTKDGRTVAVIALGWRELVDELPARVGDMLGVLGAEAAMAIERARLIAELDDIGHTDPLTGAHNRRSLDARLRDDLARASRSTRSLCALMIDLDHFKRYNDTRGHQQGDRLLRESVARWMDEVRSTDTVARYGGEEFAVILPNCSVADAWRLAERLGQVLPDGQTCSIGLAEYAPGETPDALLARADAALYEAKRAGRDRVELAAPADLPDGPGSRDLSKVMLRAARRLLDMDLAFLTQVAGGKLVFQDLDGDGEAFGLAPGDELDLDDSYCQYVIDGQSDGRIPDTRKDPRTRELPITASGKVGAYIGAPIILGDGRVVGTLCAANASAVESLSAEQLELLRGLADTIAGYIARQVGPSPTPADLDAAWRRALASVDGS